MNVVFFMSDTFCRDNFSCYGTGRTITPRLDVFASQSCIFDNAFPGSFPTIPTRLDIMSGRFSCIDHEWCPLPADTVTLQQVLSSANVITQLTADTLHMFERGFDYGRDFAGYEWIRGQEGDHWQTSPWRVPLPDGNKNRAVTSMGGR
jgi:arylsulfatase A-like enzyme